ncbi:hypothetical protein [Thermococcus sp.]|uniref:hypothetical protein n=2 Tax=Thermococcus sp. TaxID=35749 RepID=UPI0026252301|nr:hypothetical protein [Thermococcus sp.]
MGEICVKPVKYNLTDLAWFLGASIFGSIVVASIYGSEIQDIYGFKNLFLVGFLIAFGALISVFVVLQDLDEFVTGMDPNKILSECKGRVRGDLEKAYSLATERAYTLFVNFFVSWILLGAVNGVLIYYGPPHWLTTLSIGLFSLFGFISFILWIISYLRYRDYSKKLLVIQLKKNEKAEISIKI